VGALLGVFHDVHKDAVLRPAGYTARAQSNRRWASFLIISPRPGAGPGFFRRELLLADVGQTLAQFGDQRIAVGQHALEAVDRIAQQHAGVAVAS
jgi:hypothetical protein